MNINPMLACDFYKVGHTFQYPKGTTMVYSNLTPRSNTHAKVLDKTVDNKIVFFGLQGFIQWFLNDTFKRGFFGIPKSTAVNHYKSLMDSCLGKDSVDVSHIEALHDLGYLPLEIKALPEGSLVPVKVPVLTVKNTIPEFFWLTNYIETILSAELWKSCTTATTAFAYRKLLEKYAEDTGGNKDFILWQGHDFSFRGMSGIHDAAQACSGHLLSFYGTDTIPAIEYLQHYYSGGFVGGSVPATEHSVMCMGGMEDEISTFKRLIKDVYPSGVVSVVSDTWDFWRVVTEYASELKEDILSRTPNELGLAKVVFRPDSGDPADIICGTVVEIFDDMAEAEYRMQYKHRLQADNDCEAPYNVGNKSYSDIIKVGDTYYLATTCFEYNRHDKIYYYVDSTSDTSFEEVLVTPEMKGAVECLWEIFGGSSNEKGYRTLNQRVGLIYGDSITLEIAQNILQRLKKKGFASDNIVFGIGSYTYQYVTRDTWGFAMKATYGEVEGVGREIFKAPKTDQGGVKKSAKGLLRVMKEDGEYVLYDQQTWEQEAGGELQTVFKNGELVNKASLDCIRERLANYL